MEFFTAMFAGTAGEAVAKSLPFVKIVEGKMALQAALDIPDAAPLRVVSILGKARMGKSTFLNAIVSKLKSRNVKPFATQDNDEHCTRGIDAYYCADSSLLLLDCQGLALEDSSHDPALLLFAYLISDVIIFNERMMLQNEALKLLEPICAFMTYLPMDEIVKPRLYFRISDGDIVKDAGKNLEKVVCIRYNDQYQSIRDSITTLFHPSIGIVKTDSLDKGMKKRLAADEYLALFEDASLGFAPAIEEILAALPAGRPAGAWKASVPRFIESINRNDKITIEKLDVVGMVGKIALAEWVGGLSDSLFTELPADGLQATYETHIKPRQNAKKTTLSEFTRTFKTTGEAIKKPYYDKLAERLNAPIQAALEKMTAMARASVQKLGEAAVADRTLTVSNVDATLSSKTAAYWNHLLVGHADLAKACQPLYAPVKDEWIAWIHHCHETVQAAVEVIRLKETEELKALTALSGRLLSEFRTSTTATIAALEEVAIFFDGQPAGNTLLVRPETYATKKVAEYIHQAMAEVRSVPHYHEIAIVVRSRKIEVASQSAPFGDEHRPTVQHNSLRGTWDAFVACMEDPTLHKTLCDAFTARKVQLLHGRSFLSSVPPRIRDVTFVRVVGDLLGEIYITPETFDSHCAPLVGTVIEQMIKEGYLVEGDSTWLARKMPDVGADQPANVQSSYRIGHHPTRAISYIFADLHARALALERAKREGSLWIQDPVDVPPISEEPKGEPSNPLKLGVEVRKLATSIRKFNVQKMVTHSS